jgi:transposase-like protein
MRDRNHKPPHVRRAAVDSYLQGASIADVAQAAAVTVQAIRLWLDKAGVEWRDPQRKRRCAPTAAHSRDVLRRHAKGEKQKDIATAVGLSQSTVSAILRGAGHGRSPRKLWRGTDAGAVVAAYRNGATLRELRSRFGIPTTTLARWLRSAGAMRSPSEAAALRAATGGRGAEHLGHQGAFHSTKSMAWIPTGSRYEQARLSQLEADPDVARVERCQDRIGYRWNGKARLYIPDFLVVMTDGCKRVEEVKPARFVSDAKVRAKLDAAEAFYGALGTAFLIVTEAEIGQQRIVAQDHEGLRTAPLDDLGRAKRERRLLQRRVAQRGYLARKASRQTLEEREAERKKVNAYERGWRARRREAATQAPKPQE